VERRHEHQPDVATEVIELRCRRRTHAVLFPGIIEIHCRHCSDRVSRARSHDVAVYHRWDRATGAPLKNREARTGVAA